MLGGEEHTCVPYTEHNLAVFGFGFQLLCRNPKHNQAAFTQGDSRAPPPPHCMNSAGERVADLGS